jgi:hypothetical protein
VRGLPRLSRRDQRQFLRFVFDECRVMDDSRQKGEAFERLSDAIIGLVPGWTPGRRNQRTETNELDLTVFVESSVPTARYWSEQFGPTIVVECKNYPDVLPEELGKGPRKANPVVKLQGILRRTKARLGILINTGKIDEDLWHRARRTCATNRLVVLFDWRDVTTIIENPADAEEYFKFRVSNAAIGVIPPIVKINKGGKRKAKAAKPTRKSAGPAASRRKAKARKGTK